MTTDGFSTAAPEQPASSLPPFRVFLLSPANLSGERAAMIFNSGAQFEVAVRLRSAAGASVGDVFAFVSGLYFRGKRAYANAFGRPPESLASAFVISRRRDCVRWKNMSAWIGWAHGPTSKSTRETRRSRGPCSSTRKLWNAPTGAIRAFIGRGDMSRGSLLLRAVRALAATVVVFPPSLMAAAAVLSMAPFPGVTPASPVVAP